MTSGIGQGRRTTSAARAATTAAMAATAALVLGACGSPGSDRADGGRGGADGAPAVVATTTVLGDVAGRVAACGGLEVATLMPVGADPHDFAPSSADMSDLVRADLVVANGLGLEEGLGAALESARQDGAVVLEVAPLLDPIPMSDTHAHADGAHPDADEEEDHGSLDPHVWLDVARMARAAELIGDELARITGDDELAACGARVADELLDTDAEVREILAAVPPDARVLVTDHAAFGYFADAYDFTVPGVVVPGGSTLAEPSSAELAALAEVIRATGTRAVFANTADPTTLVDALADEVGRVDVVELYVGTLGPEGSGAEDYASMMLTNARLVAQALAQ